MPFDGFVGIDWSGAKGRWQKGLKVAYAKPGSGAPTLVSGPGPKDRWSRTSVFDWLAALVREKRVLIGLDFAFGFPALREVGLGWDYVEDLCAPDDGLHGGRFFRPGTGPHASYVNSPWMKGELYSPKRLRATELAAARVKGATPQSVFNAVGPAQVGPSSISGMRFLRHVQRRLGAHVVIWPFEETDPRQSTIVEIFPRYYPLSVGVRARLSEWDCLDRALKAFGSTGASMPPSSEDEGDAILSAAALRFLVSRPELFAAGIRAPAGEGWIFGVPD